MEEEKPKGKIYLSFRRSVLLALVGICIIGFGSLAPKYLTIRLAGVIVAAAGLMSMGVRLWERIKAKAKEKRDKESKATKHKMVI